MATITLNNVPGFADVPDTTLAAEKLALGIHLARINSNAAFGMVRMEVFVTTQVDKDTVPLPKSTVDGYQYTRDELLYIWAPMSTADPKSGWASDGPPWTAWYGAWVVNQDTGVVGTVMGYRGNDDHKDRQANTNDGTLIVYTVAQRRRTTLTVAVTPVYEAFNDADFYQDRALEEGVIQGLNSSAKYGVINTEVIYMGVFKNGDTVPTPTSPADGYLYSYAEVRFQTCVRWTADDDGTNLQAPDMGKGQLQSWNTSVNAGTGVVTMNVKYELFGSHTYNTGRVAVFALCTRDNHGASLGFVVDGRRTEIITDTITQPLWDYSPTGVLAPATFTPLYVDVTGAVSVNLTVTGGGILSYRHTGVLDWGPTDGTGWGGSGIEYADNVSLHPAHFAALVGCWADNTGTKLNPSLRWDVVFGNGLTVVPPLGATRLYFGLVSDRIGHTEIANVGILNVKATVLAVSHALIGDLSDDFQEIDSSVFFPGETLRVSTMQQLAANIREAAATPEFFGPTNYTNGGTVALPVSPLDGYTYTREECVYIWDWANSGPRSSGTDRFSLSNAHIDATTGAVSVDVYFFPSGGSSWALGHAGTLRVIVMAQRQLSHTQPPAQVITGVIATVTDDSNGDVTVNGV